MRTVHLDQRSGDWLAWRAAGIGGSDAPAVVGLSPWTSRQSLLAQKRRVHQGGPHAPDRDSPAMHRGRLLEPRVREAYERLTGVDAPAVCGVHDSLPFVKASFDGYCAARRLALEIKCPNADDHRRALGGHVPTKYLPQVHHLLLVADAAELHYVSFNDLSFRPQQHLAFVIVRRDHKLTELLAEAHVEFWAEVTA